MSYPIERRRGEIERLLIQAAAVEYDAGVMLDRIGVAAGWRCLDLGCGPVGILELLSRRAGSVVGLDADAVFLDYARKDAAANVELLQGDVYRTGLPSASFDLVHGRFIASTAGRAEELLAEAIRLARPGGIVAFQEPDIGTLKCYPPNGDWDRLVAVSEQVFKLAGGNVRLAQTLYPLACSAGLENVHYRPFLVGFRSGDAMTDYLPATVESLRSAIAKHGLMAERELDAALAGCREHLARADTVFNYVTVAQVWGSRPR